MSARLEFEGIRCFIEPQSAVVRPLTLLVGENSSGKSTFLALCRVACSMTRASAPLAPLFNEPPFAWGAYEQIASHNGHNRPVKHFSLKLSAEENSPDLSIQVRFASRDGQPFRISWRLDFGKEHWIVTYNEKTKRYENNRVDMGGCLDQMYALADTIGENAIALAPIRTSPRRTYDPIAAEAEPEGSHVPMLLARLSRAKTNGLWSELNSALNRFGDRSGLFSGIEVIRKGRSESDPFQIAVKTSGGVANLLDVGYGVSQALPILVDAAVQPEPATFLVQQPEVHLHPRAQAELGTFFASWINQNRRFVVETHSDHLVDRVRMEIRQGTIGPDQVSLLYFERGKNGANIHNVQLDSTGSVVNPPTGYRRFFLDEERRLLGI